MDIKVFLGTIGEIVLLVLVALAIVLPIRMYIFQPFIVNGSSMEPNFHSGDYLIVDEFSYNFIEEPQRGDIIVFKYPLNPNYKYIKRVIALPGETIKIKNGEILIKTRSGEEFLLDETTYLEEQELSEWLISNNLSEKTLEEDEYFVLGDNRNGSSDSRRWGTLPANYIEGKVFLRLSPTELLSQKLYE